jgi:hypothetical protein
MTLSPRKDFARNVGKESQVGCLTPLKKRASILRQSDGFDVRVQGARRVSKGLRKTNAQASKGKAGRKKRESRAFASQACPRPSDYVPRQTRGSHVARSMGREWPGFPRSCARMPPQLVARLTLRPAMPRRAQARAKAARLRWDWGYTTKDIGSICAAPAAHPRPRRFRTWPRTRPPPPRRHPTGLCASDETPPRVGSCIRYLPVGVEVAAVRGRPGNVHPIRRFVRLQLRERSQRGPQGAVRRKAGQLGPRCLQSLGLRCYLTWSRGDHPVRTVAVFIAVVHHVARYHREIN